MVRAVSDYFETLWRELMPLLEVPYYGRRASRRQFPVRRKRSAKGRADRHIVGVSLNSDRLSGVLPAEFRRKLCKPTDPLAGKIGAPALEEQIGRQDIDRSASGCTASLAQFALQPRDLLSQVNVETALPETFIFSPEVANLGLLTADHGFTGRATRHEQRNHEKDQGERSHSAE
jgi:hypothetical protein